MVNVVVILSGRYGVALKWRVTVLFAYLDFTVPIINFGNYTCV